MLYVGLVLGIAAGDVEAHIAGIDAFRVYVATLVLVPLALVGSRLVFVAANWSRYRGNLRRIWDRDDGGAAMYGGLALALVLSLPLLSALRVSFGAFWDVTMFSILVGMIITRVGCLLNGCCAGRPSRAWFSAYLPNRLGVWERRVPTQCLEAGWAAVLLVGAMTVRRLLPFPGALFLLVSAGYAAGRLPLESAREAEPGSAGITVYHVLSAAILLSSLATLAVWWPK